MTPLAKRIHRELKKHQQGATIKTLCAKIDVDHNAIRKALYVMEENGQVERSKYKQGKQFVWLLSGAVELPKPPSPSDRIGLAFGRVTRHLNDILRTWSR